MSGYLYVIEAGGFFKIGIARDVNKRVAGIAVSCPHSITIVLKIQCQDMVQEEMLWHQRFASKRVRGEWFRLTSEDVAEIANSYGVETIPLPLVVPVESAPVVPRVKDPTHAGLVDGKRLLEIIFPQPECRPCERTLQRLVKRRLIPSIKLGRHRYYSPEQVKTALIGKSL